MSRKLLWLVLVCVHTALAGPLHDAAAAGDSAQLHVLLLQDKAELNVPDSKGQTPLVLAVGSGSAQAVDELLLAGANVNRCGPQGWTALHEAALHGDVASTQKLLARRANPNARERQNHGTPLHVAAFQGQLEICRLLLKAGAKAAARDKEGLTPAFHAKDQAHPDVYRLLKSAGG